MKIAIAGGFIILMALGMCISLHYADNRWAGVDESVVEKFVVEANRPSQGSFINIEYEDLPFFMFLLAGTIGGFIGGYHFRGSFPKKLRKDRG